MFVPSAVGVPVAVSTIVRAPVPPKEAPEPANVTPLAVVEILYVPSVVTVAVMVCVTPAPVVLVPGVIIPVDPVEVYAETTAVPLDVGLSSVLVKVLFEAIEVIKVNEDGAVTVVDTTGVPLPVSTKVCVPVPGKVPDPTNLTPLVVAEK